MKLKRSSAKWIFFVFLMISCTFSSQKRDIQNGERAQAAGNNEAAFKFFDAAVHGSNQELALEAARHASHLAQLELKKYQRAVELYRFIIVSSDSDEERKQAQKNIAQIYFENLLYYDKAIVEYEKLLQLNFSPEEKYQFHLNIAKSHHQLGNLDQALAELDTLEKLKLSTDDFDLQVFRANVLISQKHQQDAAQILEGLIKNFPERAEKESLGLTLAVCYEELDDFKKAIDVLESMKKGYSHPEFLETRIARLRARMVNAPGANGLVK